MTSDLNMDYSKYDFKDSTELYVYLSKKGSPGEPLKRLANLKTNQIGCANLDYDHMMFF